MADLGTGQPGRVGGAVDEGDVQLGGGGGEGAAGRWQQRAAGLGEGHVAAVAHEQRGADLVLERADRRAQAGLDDVDPGRGRGEVQLLGGRDEVG